LKVSESYREEMMTLDIVRFEISHPKVTKEKKIHIILLMIFALQD